MAASSNASKQWHSACGCQWIVLSALVSFALFQAHFSLRRIRSSSAVTIFTESRSLHSQNIRQWGCHRTETPLIYIHIGKAGGGGIRRCFSLARQGAVNASKWQNPSGSWYSLPDNSRAIFCNSIRQNHLSTPIKSYEGTVVCNATTPLGHAIACPPYSVESSKKSNPCFESCPYEGRHCRQVYVGHNSLGAELHWLPRPMLKQWWQDQWQSENDTIAPLWDSLGADDESTRWCPSLANRPKDKTEYTEHYETCSIPLQKHVDQLALSHKRTEFHNGLVSWAPLYASLPVLRTVVIREPFSWLLSKYLWHKKGRSNVACDDIPAACQRESKNDYRFQREGPSWAHRNALQHIFYLCGEDCRVRYEVERSNLAQLELQASQNLRHSFAVVGLLEETQTFYEMVTARVQYLNLSFPINEEKVVHKSLKKDEETQTCRQVYSNATFQAQFVAACPAVATLVRLYETAVEVNRFQQEELRQCSTI